MSEALGAREQYWMRPLRLDDISRISSWFEEVDDLASFHRRMPLPVSASAIEASWRESLLAPEPRSAYWFAIDDEKHDAVGLGGIEDISYAHGDAITPLFLVPAVRGKGLGLRARALLLDLAFDQLRLTRVTSFHRVDNIASGRMNEACGFKDEGRIRRGWYAAGVHIDLAVFGILAEEWREQRAILRQRLDSNIILTFGSHPRSRWSWPYAPGALRKLAFRE